MPLVSVIIPTYNREKYVVEAIESVLAQTYQNFEIIIVDDGSTDGTEKILEPYRDRVVYIYQENQGPSVARNTGIRRATGQFIAFLDSDDLWLPEKLEVQVAYMETNPEVGLVHTGKLLREERPTGPILKEWPYAELSRSGHIFPEMFLEPTVSTSTVVARRECFDVAGLFDEELTRGADHHLFLRIARHFPIGYIPRPLGVYRMHETNITKKDRFQTHLGTVLAFEKLLQNNPEIVDELGAGIVRRGLFNLHFVLAYDLFDKGNARAARPYFARCIRLQPGHWPSYGYYLTSFLPHLWVNWMRQLKRNFIKATKASRKDEKRGNRVLID